MGDFFKKIRQNWVSEVAGIRQGPRDHKTKGQERRV